MTSKRIKQTGQVFTPEYMVCLMLDGCRYEGRDILKKHFIDNSCGDGAFLCAAVHRYIRAAMDGGYTLTAIKRQLATYIHGIDNDRQAYEDCRTNLDRVAAGYGIKGVRWDLHHCDALAFHGFDGKMDFVVGNPPYVRIHNLNDHYDEVRSFKFASVGMTDLYLVFFELGFRMLNTTGQLCYITPNLWLTSQSAIRLREHVMQHGNLVELMDCGHIQVFKGMTTFTMVSRFSKTHHDREFDYCIYDGKTHERRPVERLSLDDICIGSCFYLDTKENLDLLKDIKEGEVTKYVTVKNGFATQSDSIFINADVPESPITIRAVKISTGQWYNCIFPYDRNGKPLPEKTIFADGKVCRYLMDNRRKLQKGREDKTDWFLYGRTQALMDVYRPKLAVNLLVRDEKDFKIAELKEGEGIYNGLYVTTGYDIPWDEIKSIIVSPAFINYIKMLKKYKNGGYYTFNSKDLEQYINYYFSRTIPSCGRI